MKVRIAFFSIFLLFTSILFAQPLTNSDYAVYIKQYKAIAIKEMQLYKIPASITLAQGMIESGCGKSTLAVKSKNHFGIKCQKDWKGDTFYYDDDAKDECFRKYNAVEDSYRDHSIFLSTRPRYAALFTLKITDYKGWAIGLKQAGYATNPDYSNILIRLIEKNQLYQFDDPTLTQSEDVAINGPEEDDATVEKQESAVIQATPGNNNRLIFRKDYRFPGPSDFEFSYTSEEGRKVYTNLGVPFIFVKKGDTWFNIAKEFNIFARQVYKQNDLLQSDPIRPGQIIYLEPKKKKNSQRTYKVKEGDSMYSISQEKCVKLAKLLKYNKLKQGDEPYPGVELKLSRW